MEVSRPNPDTLLTRIASEESRKKRGHFRLFFGMAAGVGKTCAMLKHAHERQKEGVDVWIGIIETHGRAETLKMMDGLPSIPKKNIEYRGTMQEEMDLDAILQKRPQLVLVDELAHSNVPGSRHEKRYLDVIEILEAGIDVYSTMNVQHLESRADVVGLITAITVRETVPDSVLDFADQIELIDLTPHELIDRLKEGKIYPGRKAEQALQYFFQAGNLSALREIALRVTADKVEKDLRDLTPSENLARNKTDTEKLLVAVSASPFSEKLIRTARRMAEDSELPWVAVHVDTGKILEKEAHNQLIKNLELAREMGAEILTLHGSDVAATMTGYVKSNHIVQMVLGRPAGKSTFKTRQFLKRAISDNPQVDIVILQQPDLQKPVPGTWRLKLGLKPGPYFMAAFWVLLTALASHFVTAYIGYRAVGFIFLLLIIILSIFLPFGPILTAAALTAIIWDYYFIPPQGYITIQAPEDIMMLLAYFVIACAGGFLTFQIKRNQNILRDREERTRALYDILKSMTLVGGVEPMLEMALSRINDLFDAEACVFLAVGHKLDDKPTFGKLTTDVKDQAVAAWSFLNGRMAGWSTSTLPLSQTLSICLKSGDKKFGVLMFKPHQDRKLNPDQQTLLLSIANQMAMALAKKQYEEVIQQAVLLKESEKLHQTLLNCISHELRTPLTAIVGAATTLQSQSVKLKEEPLAVLLLGEIVLASDRLNHVFENLLDMTRLESGMITLSREWFDVAELVHFTVDRQQKFLLGHSVQIQADEKSFYFFGDFNLLEHAFSNLLLNASHYSPEPSPIVIKMERTASDILIRFMDRGSGIPVDKIPSLFEKFYRLPGSPAGGLGLGLSITKNLVELHGGQIQVENNPEGGATFTVVLPYTEPPQAVQESSL